jgi:hypothetical protein
MGGVPEQWEVKSGDGGSIAVWVEGDGPPLVLVHGSVSDHAAFAPLVGELRDEFTIFAMDRRGFGASRDGPNYSAEREFSDVAAVVERSFAHMTVVTRQRGGGQWPRSGSRPSAGSSSDSGRCQGSELSAGSSSIACTGVSVGCATS